MGKLDDYIDLVCKDLKGNDEELTIMKQEMKNHLLQSVEELKLQGKSQEDSINIAIDRFGEVDILKNQLKEVYNVEKNFSKKIFNIALALLLMGIIALISQIYINYNSQNIGSKLLYSVEDMIKNDNTVSNKVLKTLFDDNSGKFKFNNKELKYIAVFKYPKDYNGNTDTTSLKYAEYIYPSIEELNNNLEKSGYIANAYSDKDYLSDNKWHISIGYITPKAQGVEYAVNTALKVFTIICIVSGLILFSISVLISIYHKKRVSFI